KRQSFRKGRQGCVRGVFRPDASSGAETSPVGLEALAGTVVAPGAALDPGAKKPWDASAKAAGALVLLAVGGSPPPMPPRPLFGFKDIGALDPWLAWLPGWYDGKSGRARSQASGDSSGASRFARSRIGGYTTSGFGGVADGDSGAFTRAMSPG